MSRSERSGRSARAAALLAVTLACAGAAPHAPAYSDARCTRLEEARTAGPFDWRDASDEVNRYRKQVLDFHFKNEHQRGALSGSTSANVWENLDYTLRWFPNFPRALYLLGVFEHQVNRNNPQYLQKLLLEKGFPPLNCYFERAVRFAPEDPNVHNALGIMLSRRGQRDDAIKAFSRAVKVAPESPEAHYNLGLAYYAAQRYEDSAASARRAYELGYRKQELKARLKKKGYWN